MNVRTKILLLTITCGFIAFSFNGCSKDVENVSSKNASSTDCDPILVESFKATYYPFLVQNCNGCHVPGGLGNGAFADSNPDSAYDAFALKGAARVRANAVNPNHKPPATGPQHQTTINTFDVAWKVAEEEHTICVKNSGRVVAPEPSVTTSKIINGGSIIRTISWNLSKDIAFPKGQSFNSAKFSLDVVVEIRGETKSYVFSSPRLTAGDQALAIRLVEIKINDTLVTTATTYRGVDRKVPKNSQRILSTTSMVVPFDVQTSDRLSVQMDELITTEFNPPTFAQLSASNGIFTLECSSCHNAANKQGNLDIANLPSLFSQFFVSPMNPSASSLLQAMTHDTAPMPPSGPLDQGAINSVRDWILDGAPP